MDKQEFEVELLVTTNHLMTTFSRTPEEAIQDAEDLYLDGEHGEVLNVEIEAVDAFPVGEDSEEADEDDAEDE